MNCHKDSLSLFLSQLLKISNNDEGCEGVKS